MTTYKDIRGTHIVTVASDPPAPANGQVWYNSTDRVMKGFTENPVGSWATGGAMNTARFGNQAAFGIQTAALAFGGNTPAPAVSGATKTWNGSVWYETTDLSTARMTLAGAGTSTAALAVGGQTPTVVATTEEWNAPTTSTVTFTAS